MAIEAESRELDALQRDVLHASEHDGDPDAIEQVYSTDFFAITPGGSTSTNEEVQEIVNAGVFPGSETVATDETQGRVFGDMAVVTGRSVWAGDQTVTVRHTNLDESRRPQAVRRLAGTASSRGRNSSSHQ